MLQISRRLMRSRDPDVKDECRRKLLKESPPQVKAALAFGTINEVYDDAIDEVLGQWLRNSKSEVPTKSDIGPTLLKFSTKFERLFSILLEKVKKEKLSLNSTIKEIKKLKDELKQTGSPKSYFLPDAMLNSFSKRKTNCIVEIGPETDLEDGIPNFEVYKPRLLLIAPNKVKGAMSHLKSYTSQFLLDGTHGAVVFTKIQDEAQWSEWNNQTVSPSKFVKIIHQGGRGKFGYFVL